MPSWSKPDHLTMHPKLLLMTVYSIVAMKLSSLQSEPIFCSLPPETRLVPPITASPLKLSLFLHWLLSIQHVYERHISKMSSILYYSIATPLSFLIVTAQPIFLSFSTCYLHSLTPLHTGFHSSHSIYTALSISRLCPYISRGRNKMYAHQQS